MNKNEIGWKELLKNNVRLQDVFNRIAIGDELQMMSPFLEAMTIVSAAKTLKGGASYLFLSQCLATIGIDKETSPCGFVGKAVNKLADKIASALLSEAVFSEKPTIDSAMLLKKIVKGVTILSIVGGRLLALKMEPDEKDEKKDETSKIYGELLLLLMASSGILKSTFKEFALACKASEKTQDHISNILFLFSALLIGFSQERTKKRFKVTLELLSHYFDESLTQIDELLSQKAHDGTVDKEKLSSIHAVLAQAKLSLENNNFENFIKALEMGLESVGISSLELEQDILEIEQVTDNVRNTILTGLTDFSYNGTEITVIA